MAEKSMPPNIRHGDNDNIRVFGASSPGKDGPLGKNGQPLGPITIPGNVPLQHPIVKIGHYVLGETLGVGTFGKVKSMELLLFFLFLLNDIQ